MVIHKQKKNKRQRAGTTHGWGSMKKHRGAGHRGGRGRAGTGKRGDAKKPSFWKKKKYFGVNGFGKKTIKTHSINLNHIDDNAESWARQGLIEKGAGVFKVDLDKLGYDKLLGTGKVNKKLEISVKQASPRALEKIEAAGGKVILTAKAAPEPVAPAEKAPSAEKAEKEAPKAEEAETADSE